MTKKQKADALLKCACAWQNDTYVRPWGLWKSASPDLWMTWVDEPGPTCTDVAASAALSEAAGLGFDLEDA